MSWRAGLVLLAAGCAGAGGAGPSAPAGLLPFVGVFRGTLRLHGATGVAEVPMGLDVEPVGAGGTEWTWRLHYGDGERAQVRDYRLLVDDLPTGRCRIDERNGIVLHARLVDGELVSVFAAGDQLLVARYRAVPDGLRFALEAFGRDAGVPAAARDAAAGPDGPVRSWPTVAHQRAHLVRQGPR